jgi:hypothetical protein
VAPAALGFRNRLSYKVHHAVGQHLQPLRISERKLGVPISPGRDLLVELESLRDDADHLVGVCVRRREVVEVHAEDQFADRLRAEFEHVLVNVPGLALSVELVKDVKSLLHSLLHCGSIVADCFGAERWRQEFVGDPPFFRICVAQEDTGLLVLDGVERVVLVDELCEEV